MRIAFADLARIAELHVADVTGVEPRAREIAGLTRGAVGAARRSRRTAAVHRAGHVARQPVDQPDDDEPRADPMMAMMAGLRG